MNQEEVIQSISEHFSGNAQSTVFILGAALILLFVGILLFLVVHNSRREKTNVSVLHFLTERHRLLPHEVDILLETSNKKGLSPNFSLMIDPTLFSQHQDAIKEGLFQRIQIRQQSDKAFLELKHRLFKT